MSRRLTTLLLAFAAVSLVTLAMAEDDIYTKGKGGKVKGAITAESAKGVKVKSGDFYKEDEIDDIFYELGANNPVNVILSYRNAFNSEREWADTTKDQKKRNLAYADAFKKYSDSLAGTTDKRIKTHLEFKLAYMTARKAMEDGSSSANGITRLSEFAKANPQSWQIVRTLRMLAKLQLEANRLAEMKDSYTQLSKLDVPEEVKQDAMLQIAMADVQLGQHAAAEPKLAELLKTLKPDSPVYARVLVAQADCLFASKQADKAIAILKKTTKDSTDKNVKAIAYNTLGVYYYNSEDDKLKDARWEFLWVDVVYNQDKNEHAKALYYLTHTFEKLGEQQRADECREILLSDKSFSGTEFQRKMMKEKAK
jgi:tetratricopeptide (TPR) repeat protein